MAGWLDELIELNERKKKKRRFSPSFVVHRGSGVVFSVVGATFDVGTGSLTFRLLERGCSAVIVVSEADLKANFRYL
jgi:hypothetical protein